MKPTMYVEKRSDLTLLKKAFELTDATCHRTRLKCGCKAYKGADNNRDSLLIVKYDAVVLEIIRCWKIQCKLPPKTKRFCPLVLK